MLTSLLTALPSVFEPFILALIGLMLIGLACLFILRPASFLPVFFVAAPFPKLFSIGLTERAQSYNSLVIVTKPGISFIEIVAAAGVLALFLSPGKKVSVFRKNSGLGKKIVCCMGSALLSLVVGRLLYPEIFHWSQLLYGIRHVSVFACFFLARRYALTDRNARSPLSGAMDVIRRSGNVIVVLGLLYYVFIGRNTQQDGMSFARSGVEGVWRNYLWFFDYGYDMGFYVALVGVLNVSRTLLKGPGRTSVGNALFWLAVCSFASLCIGARGNPIMFAVMMALFTYLAGRNSGGSRTDRRVLENMLLYFGFILAAFVGLYVLFTPQKLESKIETSAASETYGTSEALAREIGIPDDLAQVINELPIGDWKLRLILNAGSIMYFVQHLYGTGYGGEVAAVGWLSHYDLTTVAVEQGILGLICYSMLLWHLLVIGFRTDRERSREERYSFFAVRAMAITMVVLCLVMSLTSIYLQKFSIVFWALLGVYDASVSRRILSPGSTPLAGGEAQNPPVPSELLNEAAVWPRPGPAGAPVGSL